MRIAVNTRLLLPGKLEGIGWFTAETLKRITTTHPEHQFYFIFDRPWSEEFIFSGNITPVIVPPETRHPFLWYYWFEHKLPPVLNKVNADIFLSPDGYLSLSDKRPSLPVIHDVNFMHNQIFHPWLTRRYYRYFFPRFASKASHIVTVSEYSKQDISSNLGVPLEKIDVVYNGVNEQYSALSSEERDTVKKRLTGGCDYFLYVGSFHGRKNLSGLLRAYDLFKKRSGNPAGLVLVGEKMYHSAGIDKIIRSMNYGRDVIITGRKEPQELREIYGAALALVFVPFFEGFGVPLLEAMMCEIPVITSNCTSLPEVAGDAAMFVDPFNIESVVAGMQKIIYDEDMRVRLIEKSKIRREMFSWDKTANLLWESVCKVMKTSEMNK